MNSNGIVTLTTDFGLADTYVGVMKGVMLGINPTLRLVDLTHGIAPQDVWAARFQLANGLFYFPLGTVHLAIVDPGVGTDREAIAIQWVRGWLVGPNNGIFSGILEKHPAQKVVRLDNPDYWLGPQVSQTFHGRDIFAPVAAHLASGVVLEQLGQVLEPEQIEVLSLPSNRFQTERQGRLLQGDRIRASIQHIDHFGNAITTLMNERLRAESWNVSIGETLIPGAQAYGVVSVGEPLALRGSHGYIEIAVNQGSAQTVLGLSVGDVVTVEICEALRL